MSLLRSGCAPELIPKRLRALTRLAGDNWQCALVVTSRGASHVFVIDGGVLHQRIVCALRLTQPSPHLTCSLGQVTTPPLNVVHRLLSDLTSKHNRLYRCKLSRLSNVGQRQGWLILASSLKGPAPFTHTACPMQDPTMSAQPSYNACRYRNAALAPSSCEGTCRGQQGWQ